MITPQGQKNYMGNREKTERKSAVCGKLNIYVPAGGEKREKRPENRPSKRPENRPSKRPGNRCRQQKTEDKEMAVSKELIKKLEAFADAHIDELTEELFKLCRIDSVRTAPEPGAPFGKGPKAALEAASALAEKKGFAVKNYDNYVCTADLNAGAEAAFDMLGHVDVVPAGDGWTETTAFEPVKKGDILYGRGVADDKGGVVAALYAMQAVKELGLPISKRCRLIIGSSEETGMEDVRHYYTKEKAAPMTATPDAEYPVICGEKGRVAPVFEANFEASNGARKLLFLDGGIAVNQVPASAIARLAGVSKEEAEKCAAAVTAATKVKFSFLEDGDALVIRADGKSAHGSMPELGINSVQALSMLVLSLGLDACKGLEILKNYTELFPFGDFLGKACGMAVEDAISGPTSCAADIIHMTETTIHGEVDFRTAFNADAYDPGQILGGKAAAAGLEVIFREIIKSHYVPAESEFVQTLVGCYEEVTGKKGKASIMGGNSYVHEIDGGVCFGYVTDDAEACIHGPNEHIPVKDLRDTIVIYGLAIAQLCK